MIADAAVGAAAREVAGGQLQTVAKRLRAVAATGDPRAVHDARRRLKKLRALLRLLREATGEACFARENIRLRDVGRHLSCCRDLQLCRQLLATGPRWLRRLPEVAVLGRELAATHAGPAPYAVAGEVLAAALADIEAARAGVAEWPVDGLRQDDLWRGWLRFYQRARRAMRAAVRQPVPERLHTWRKRVKDLWYGTLLLRDWRRDCRARVAGYKGLAVILGDEHDLHVVEGVLRARAGAVAEETWATLAARATRLATKAFELGGEVLGPKTAAVATELGGARRRGHRGRQGGARVAAA